MTAGAVDCAVARDGDERQRCAELLARAAEGDRAAFMEVYDATCASVYGLLLCRLGEPAAAEQAAGALYVTAWSRAAEHAGSGVSALAWLVSHAPAG